MSSIKEKTLHSVKWTAINSVGNRIYLFVVGLVLARLLEPSDYGIVAMASIFFAIAGILVDSGLSASLIRKKDLTNEDISTVFFFNVVVSGICCIILCLFSGYISDYLNTPELADMIKVSAIGLFIGAFGSVQWTLITKSIDFKTPALVSIPVGILSSLLGILLAYIGYGAWSLVWSSFASTVANAVIIWFISPWRPSFLFSIKSFREFFSFSGNLLVNAILDKFFNEGMGFIIGKYYTPKQLGFYSKGQSTATMPCNFLYNMVGNVTYPILSKIQEDDQQLQYVYSRFMRTLSVIIFFAMLLIASIAKPLTIVLYTEKWLPAVVFLQLFCLNFMFYHIHAINWNFLLVKGRSDWGFRKEIINKFIKIMLIAVAIPEGPLWICIALLVSSIFDLFINTIITGYLFGYGLKKQFSDFLPYMFIAGLCCIPSYLLSLTNLTPLLLLFIQVPLSATLYFVVLCFVKKDPELFDLLNIIAKKNPFFQSIIEKIVIIDKVEEQR